MNINFKKEGITDKSIKVLNIIGKNQKIVPTDPALKDLASEKDLRLKIFVAVCTITEKYNPIKPEGKEWEKII